MCPVGALEHVAGKDVDGVGNPHMGTVADAGKPLDTPIRGYQRYEEGPDGKVIPVQAPAPSPKRKRKKPFEAELALLRELGLR